MVDKVLYKKFCKVENSIPIFSRDWWMDEVCGEDLEFKKSQAIVLLIWEVIKFSSKITNKFDFKGSIIKPIEKFFSSFGAKQKQYFNINKEYIERNLLYFIAKDIYCHY